MDNKLDRTGPICVFASEMVVNKICFYICLTLLSITEYSIRLNLIGKFLKREKLDEKVLSRFYVPMKQIQLFFRFHRNVRSE